MLSVLSQITIKVPFYELLRIPKHKDRGLAWMDSVQDSNVACNTNEP